jgi:predicted esterase
MTISNGSASSASKKCEVAGIVGVGRVRRSFRRASVWASFALAALVLAGCMVPKPPGAAPLRYRDPVFANITQIASIQYGMAPDVNGNPVALMLDLYEPAQDRVTRRPAIVWVHGGGYCCGTAFSSTATTLAKEFAHHGYVTVSIDYRQLVPGGCSVIDDTLTPACEAAAVAAEHDAQAAVRWLRANATMYGIDPNRIGIGGESAGAITATLVGLDPQDPGDSGNPGYSSTVNAFMSLSGGVQDGKFTAGPGDAPGLLFSGTADTTVPFAWSVKTALVMLQHHVPAFMEPLADAGHIPYYPPYQAQIDSQSDYFFYDFLDAADAQGSPPSAARIFHNELRTLARRYPPFGHPVGTEVVPARR